MRTDQLAATLRRAPLSELGPLTWTAADRLLEMEAKIKALQEQLHEWRSISDTLAGDRCECVNVFLTAGGIRYTQCAPCAYREWLDEQE